MKDAISVEKNAIFSSNLLLLRVTLHFTPAPLKKINTTLIESFQVSSLYLQNQIKVTTETQFLCPRFI